MQTVYVFISTKILIKKVFTYLCMSIVTRRDLRVNRVDIGISKQALCVFFETLFGFGILAVDKQ